MKWAVVMVCGMLVAASVYWGMDRLASPPSAQPVIDAVERVDSEITAQVNIDTINEHMAAADAIRNKWWGSLSSRQRGMDSSQALDEAVNLYGLSVLAKRYGRDARKSEDYKHASNWNSEGTDHFIKARQKLNEAKAAMK